MLAMPSRNSNHLRKRNASSRYGESVCTTESTTCARTGTRTALQRLRSRSRHCWSRSENCRRRARISRRGSISCGRNATASRASWCGASLRRFRVSYDLLRPSTTLGHGSPLNVKNPALAGFLHDSPYGIRTRAAAVRGRCPRPLDEWAVRRGSVPNPAGSAHADAAALDGNYGGAATGPLSPARPSIRASRPRRISSPVVSNAS